MGHIPTGETGLLELVRFEDALAAANQPSADYDVSKWLYVPNFYSEYRYILGTRGEKPLICVGINPSSGDGTVKQDLCKEFVSFISTMDAQQRRFSIDGTIPAQQDLAGYDPIIAAEVNTMRDCTVLLLNNRQMTNYFNCMDTYIQNILDGQINVSNYKQAVELLNQQLNT